MAIFFSCTINRKACLSPGLGHFTDKNQCGPLFMNINKCLPDIKEETVTTLKKKGGGGKTITDPRGSNDNARNSTELCF